MRARSKKLGLVMLIFLFMSVSLSSGWKSSNSTEATTKATIPRKTVPETTTKSSMLNASKSATATSVQVNIAQVSNISAPVRSITSPVLVANSSAPVTIAPTQETTESTSVTRASISVIIASKPVITAPTQVTTESTQVTRASITETTTPTTVSDIEVSETRSTMPDNPPPTIAVTRNIGLNTSNLTTQASVPAPTIDNVPVTVITTKKPHTAASTPVAPAPIPVITTSKPDTTVSTPVAPAPIPVITTSKPTTTAAVPVAEPGTETSAPLSTRKPGGSPSTTSSSRGAVWQRYHGQGLTCSTNKSIFADQQCGNLCDIIAKGVPKDPVVPDAINNVWFLVIVAVLCIMINALVWGYYWCITKKLRDANGKNLKKSSPKAADSPGRALRQDLLNNRIECKETEDKSPLIESPTPPSDRHNPNKMKTKLQETQANLAKLRNHVRKTAAQHKSDTRSSKFKKKGPIFIPREPEIVAPAKLPDNIILEEVIYDPTGNEIYDIGSDIDDIELDTSLILDTVTLTEEEVTKKSKRDEKKKDDKKKDEKKEEKKELKELETKTPREDGEPPHKNEEPNKEQS